MDDDDVAFTRTDQYTASLTCSDSVSWFVMILFTPDGQS